MLGDSLELENSHRSSLRIDSALATNFSRGYFLVAKTLGVRLRPCPAVIPHVFRTREELSSIRRPDRSRAQRGVAEGPSVSDRRLIVERRSLRSASLRSG